MPNNQRYSVKGRIKLDILAKIFFSMVFITFILMFLMFIFFTIKNFIENKYYNDWEVAFFLFILILFLISIIGIFGLTIVKIIQA